jgi:hypothetical protein
MCSLFIFILFFIVFKIVNTNFFFKKLFLDGIKKYKTKLKQHI